jgi:hypothetical protein
MSSTSFGDYAISKSICEIGLKVNTNTASTHRLIPMQMSYFKLKPPI